jgi:dihydrolipoamide dehydrogenase
MAAYPDPPPVILLPESDVAQAAYAETLLPGSARPESTGIAKCLFNKDTGKVLGVHIIGMHAADLIQECANAISAGTTVKELAMMVHTHPTLCEVLDETFKGAVGMSAH